MTHKYLKFFISIAALLLLFVSCNNDVNINEPESTLVDDTGNKTQIYVVIPASSSSKLIESANTLAEYIKQQSGIKTEVKKDSAIADSKRKDKDTLFFLIGTTNFDETSAVYANLAYGSQTVTMNNGHVVVAGWYEQTLIAAVNSCRKIVDKYVDNGQLLIPMNLSQTSQIENTLDALPVYPEQYPTSMYDCGDGCLMLILKSNEKGYIEYLDSLIDFGYKAYAHNQIANIKYDTYENNLYVINTVRYMSTGETRLLIEPLSKTGLPDKDAGSFTYKNQTTLTQFGLHFENDDSDLAGMSYAIQLQDGSFIIIDGGYCRDKDADQLYNYMREHTSSNEPIVIAAWVITHGHHDHIGCFMKFTEKYLDKVTVERFIYNDPASSQRNITGDGPYYQKNRLYMQKYTDAIIYKAHPGQKYKIRNSTIEIYYTVEMYAPNNLVYYNDCSLVFSVEVEGQKIMFLGDISENVSPLIAAAYRETLECDILQVAHHGYAGGTAELYQYLNPTYVLWPAPQSIYTTRITNKRYKPFHDSKKLKVYFVADNKITTLTFNTDRSVSWTKN